MAASTQATNRLRSRAVRKLYDFDPDATTVTAIGWVPLAQFQSFLCAFFRTIGTSTVTFDIAAATDSSGTGATQVKAHAVGSQPDAVGDQLWLEVTADEVRSVLATATHISARVSVATSTDEGVVYYERSDPRYPQTGLTVDLVA